MRTHQNLGGLPQDIGGESLGYMPGSIDLKRVQKSSVPDSVAINFTARRKPGMKIQWDHLASEHSHFAWQMSVERGQPHFP
jgi:hypothetical protein